VIVFFLGRQTDQDLRGTVFRFSTSAETRAWIANNKDLLMMKHRENLLRVISNRTRAEDGGDLAGKQLCEALRRDPDWRDVSCLLAFNCY